MLKKTFKQLFLAGALSPIAMASQAGYEVKVTDNDTITFGGYIKADVRYVSGDVAYRDYWIGAGKPLAENKTQFKIFANETRFNAKYVHGDVMGFIEMDFYGGGGNEIISNSANPRIRHAFIKYKNVLVGQTWSTLMNTSAIPETADFAGATLGLVFIRQGQIRYTAGNFQFALENPESWGGDSTEDDLPDVIAKYTFKGDWGNVSLAGVGRQLTLSNGDNEHAIGVSVAGRIKTVGKDDLRFQVHKGELGRYVGAAIGKGIYNDKVEETTSFLVGYRHFWTDGLRSTFLYGKTETDLSNAERSQWSVNIFKDLTPQLTAGFEVGNFSMDDANADSNYGQFSVRYVL